MKRFVAPEAESGKKGHQYLPFIVWTVLDGVTDLIMTSKEISAGDCEAARETIGIHLIITTQTTSSEYIITGDQRADFPARIAHLK